MEKEIHRLKMELEKFHSERTRQSWQSMTERDGAGAEIMDIADLERSHPRNRDNRCSTQGCEHERDLDGGIET